MVHTLQEITKCAIQNSEYDVVCMAEFAAHGQAIEMTIYADHNKETTMGEPSRYDKAGPQGQTTVEDIANRIIIDVGMAKDETAWVIEQIECISEHYKEAEKQLQDDPSIFNGTKIPDPYVMTKEGVKMARVNKDGEVELKMLTSTPLSITGVGVNVDNEDHWVKVYLETALGQVYSGWRKYGDLMCKSGALELMNKGLTSTEATSKDINAYLLALYINNAQELPRQIMASTYGWKCNHTQFIIGNLAVSQDRTDLCILDEKDGEGNVGASSGDLSEWIRGVGAVINNDLARFKCYAMCAAPIIELIGNHSFLVEHVGTSGSGKTTTALIARSMFTNPKLLDPTSTSRGIEKVGAKYGSIGLIFDETRAVNDFQKAVYNMINVNSRATSDKEQNLRESKRANTVIMTTSESSLLHDNAYEGIQARVLTLTDALPSMPEEVPRAEKAVKANYGLIGPLFIQKVMKYKNKLMPMYNRYLEMIPDSDATQAGRRKAHFGLMALAGQILEEVFGDIEMEHPELKGIVHEKDAAKICEKYFKETVQENAFEPQDIQALRLCYDQVTINPRAFYHETCTDKGTTLAVLTGTQGDVMGWVSDDRIDYHKAALAKFLNDEGQVNLKQLGKIWASKGLLNINMKEQRTFIRVLKKGHTDTSNRETVVSFDRASVEAILGGNNTDVRTVEEMSTQELYGKLKGDAQKFCDEEMAYDLHMDDVMLIATDVWNHNSKSYESIGIALEDVVEAIGEMRIV